MGRAPGTGGRRGATTEENPDDRRATAGGVFALLRDARALLPGIDEAALVEVTPRARPATPDNLPLVGPTDVPGCTSRRATAATASCSPRSRPTPSSPGSAAFPGTTGPSPADRPGDDVATALATARTDRFVRTATTPR